MQIRKGARDRGERVQGKGSYVAYHYSLIYSLLSTTRRDPCLTSPLQRSQELCPQHCSCGFRANNNKNQFGVGRASQVDEAANDSLVTLSLRSENKRAGGVHGEIPAQGRGVICRSWKPSQDWSRHTLAANLCCSCQTTSNPTLALPITPSTPAPHL